MIAGRESGSHSVRMSIFRYLFLWVFALPLLIPSFLWGQSAAVQVSPLEKGLQWSQIDAIPADAVEIPAAIATGDLPEGVATDALVVAQRNGFSDCYYVFDAGAVHEFSAKSGRWTTRRPAPVSFENASSTAFPVGEHYIFLVTEGGGLFAYHTITDGWAAAGSSPVALGSSAVFSRTDQEENQQFFLKGLANSAVAQLTIAPPQREFGVVNYATLGLYLLALVAMGFVFSKRMHSTDDFFKAGGRIPWWAAGISIFGTQLSAITFMAIPALTFAQDWTRFWGQLSIVAVAPFVVIFFLPFFRRLQITTAYEYLERRFDSSIRIIASSLFILMQFGRIGIVLLLPSIALHVVTGMGIHTCILLMGVLCILYTVLGGIEAVIWTDVLQVIVLTGGAILCLILMAVTHDGGWNAMVSTADVAGKFRTFDFRFDLSDSVFLVIVLGGFGNSLVSYGSDQAVIQRYLTTPTEKAAAHGVWMGTLLSIPASLLFFMIGTALYVFYQSNPEMLDPALTKTSYIFPYFITTQLPAGIAGLLIAAIFAASMSSLDSSMNSVAAAFTTDFYRKRRPQADEATCLRVARGTTIVIGVLGTVFAIVLAEASGVKPLWDQFNQILGLFGGTLCGLFCLAIFAPQVSTRAALAGVAISIATQIAVKMYFYPELHSWFYGIMGIVACVAGGMVASLVFPRPSADSLNGLTWKHRQH
ncbi:MAG: SSS family solute:Na+ symporter [Verrucomicrobiales bacterium]|jgi:SSS family solute:Na+ symporter